MVKKNKVAGKNKASVRRKVRIQKKAAKRNIAGKKTRTSAKKKVSGRALAEPAAKQKGGRHKTILVKRRGHEEHYDERKVYASCYSACLGTHLTPVEAEQICSLVSKEVTKWIRTQKEIDSEAIFRQVVVVLKGIDKDVAFMYETHRDIS